jgi:hypothetical protein
MRDVIKELMKHGNDPDLNDGCELAISLIRDGVK